MPKGRLHKWLDGAVEKPRGDAIDILARALGVDALWLSHGLSIPNDEAGGELIKLLKDARVVPLTLLSTLKSVDDLDALKSAGEAFSLVPKLGPRTLLVPIDDDSMAPRYPRGAVVLVDPDAPPLPGKCVVANTSLGAVVRRVRSPDGRRLELHPENPDFPVILINQPSDAVIIGRVILHIVVD